MRLMKWTICALHVLYPHFLTDYLEVKIEMLIHPRRKIIDVDYKRGGVKNCSQRLERLSHS